MERKFYSEKDLRAITGCARSTIYNWMSREDFPKIRVGNRILVPIDAFNRWIDEQMITKRN